MKKIYLCALALSVGTATFAQTAKQNAIALKNNTISNSIKTATKAPQDKGLTLWSDDFSSIATWNLTNTSTPAQDWVYTTNPTAVPVLSGNPVSFTTASNGYLYIDSDDLGSGSSQNISVENVTAIDLSGKPNVSLIWEQHYISFQETFTVSVSGDNGANYTDYIIPGGGGQTQVYETMRLNISAVAGNQSQVFVKFNYQGAYDWMWSIDDVEIQETDPNDLVASDPYYGSASLAYTRIPVAQIQPISFAMKATNIGSADQTGTILTADVNSGMFTGTSAPSTVVVGATDSLTVTTQWTPAATTGVPYTITLSVASDFTDATPADNSFVYPPLEVSADIYAMDDYSATPGNGGGNYQTTGDEFEAGNFYDIVANQTCYAVDVMIGTNAVAGNTLEGVIYELNASGTFVQVDRSNIIQVTAATIGTLVSFPMPNTPMLTAGKTYFAAVHTYSGAGEFFYGTSGTSPSNTEAGGTSSLIFYPNMANPGTGTNFYTTSTPMIRLNFNSSVGVANVTENTTTFNVYPNPSTGEFNINLNKDLGATVNLTVKNVVGQTVINKQIAVTGNQVETISLANYDKGIYFLTINNETVKLIVE